LSYKIGDVPPQKFHIKLLRCGQPVKTVRQTDELTDTKS